MTEKRFKVAVYDDKAINGFAVLDLQKPNSSKRLEYENVYIGSKEGCEIVCNFGNNLAEENEQLKMQLQSTSDQRDEFHRGARENANRVGKLKKENEQLKNEKESWKKSWIEEMEDQEEQSKCILKLVKENEKLKSTVKEVLGLLSDEVDLFSDKATEHDINAYIELKELDNKDAFYMATATKKAIKMLKELQE